MYSNCRATADGVQLVTKSTASALHFSLFSTGESSLILSPCYESWLQSSGFSVSIPSFCLNLSLYSIFILLSSTFALLLVLGEGTFDLALWLFCLRQHKKLAAFSYISKLDDEWYTYQKLHDSNLLIYNEDNLKSFNACRGWCITRLHAKHPTQT